MQVVVAIWKEHKYEIEDSKNADAVLRVGKKEIGSEDESKDGEAKKMEPTAFCLCYPIIDVSLTKSHRVEGNDTYSVLSASEDE